MEVQLNSLINISTKSATTITEESLEESIFEKPENLKMTKLSSPLLSSTPLVASKIPRLSREKNVNFSVEIDENKLTNESQNEEAIQIKP